MDKPTILVTIEGGLIQDIDWPEALKGLFRILVMDFDDAEPGAENYRETVDGHGYYEGIWED